MQFIYDILLVALIWAGIEITIFTFITRVLTKDWWWHRSTNQDWEFKFGANSWSFNGAGVSPLDTLNKFWDSVSGRNKSVQDIIKSEINNEIRTRTQKAVKKAVSHSSVARQVSQMITTEITSQLKNNKK